MTHLSLNFHIRRKHWTHTCLMCGMKFVNNADIETHVKKTHPFYEKSDYYKKQYLRHLRLNGIKIPDIQGCPAHFSYGHK